MSLAGCIIVETKLPTMGAMQNINMINLLDQLYGIVKVYSGSPGSKKTSRLRLKVP
jgi:hypothetical protein